jgi:alkylresorcinol/alkylpyrone synthase
VETVRISRVAVAHPPHRVPQAEAGRRIGLLTGDPRRAAAIARGSGIATRATVLPPDDLERLGSIEERNRAYQASAPLLARKAACDVLGAAPARPDVGCLVTSSCTGYTIPGWGAGLIPPLGLSPETSVLPITESGCAGGAVALGRAADFVRAHGRAALAVASEACSLALHPDAEEGNLTAALIFSDGAGAALLEPGLGPGLVIHDALTRHVPGSRDLLGFDLQDRGLVPVLSRELVDALVPAAGQAVAALLGRNGLAPRDVAAWLFHPGGSRILRALEVALALGEGQARWSWESMREFGNTSSAAIFDILRRYLLEPGRPGPAVLAAFGPGVTIELLLLDLVC